MNPSIVVPGARPGSTHRITPDHAWHILGWLGFALTGVGGFEILLLCVPPRIGTPEWEFSTVTALMNSMPILSIGLGLMLSSALAHGTAWLARTTAIVFALLAFAIVGSALLYAMSIPIAMKAAPNPIVLEGLKKAIAKTAVQAFVFPVIFLLIAVKGWRRAGRN